MRFRYPILFVSIFWRRSYSLRSIGTSIEQLTRCWCSSSSWSSSGSSRSQSSSQAGETSSKGACCNFYIMETATKLQVFFISWKLSIQNSIIVIVLKMYLYCTGKPVATRRTVLKRVSAGFDLNFFRTNICCTVQHQQSRLQGFYQKDVSAASPPWLTRPLPVD